MTEETTKYFESIMAMYVDNIRSADYRALSVLFFLSVSIPTIVAFREELPASISIFILLVFPLCGIIFLILTIYPRFIVLPGFPFYFKRSISPADFVLPPDNENELLALLRNRCVALAQIFYWKIRYFRLALSVSLLYLVILLLFALGGLVRDLAFPHAAQVSQTTTQSDRPRQPPPGR